MKHRIRKLTSVLLAVIMMLSVLTVAPFTVSALGTANDIVNVAQGEVGVSGQPNKYTYWLGSINGSYSYAWCHAFVSWCANQAGVGDKVPKTASCATGVNWFKNRGEWKSRSSGYTPKAGDIIYFDYGSNGTYDHVGIVTSSSGGRVYTIEGNARNAVKVNGGYSNGYSLSSTDILGYGTPSYSNPNPPETPSSIWTDFDNYLPGNITVHWNASANASSYWLTGYITRANGERYCFMDQDVGNTTNHLMGLMDAGVYTIYVSGVNNGNRSSTTSCNFEVISKGTTPRCLKTCTYDGHTYKLYSSSLSWESAKTWCENNGGYLATVTSNVEQVTLWKLLSNHSNMCFYLGGSSTSGQWKWVTNEDFKYTAWAKDQPDCAGNKEFYLGTWGEAINSSDDIKLWNDFTNNYANMAGFIFESGVVNEPIDLPSDNLPTVQYSVNTKNSDWSENEENGEVIGEENGNRFRAVKINLNNCNGGIKYSAHFSNSGWSDFVSDDEICGSTNDTSSIEAIKMELYGDITNLYNIYYCTYVRDLGWFGWAKNGEISGSTGGSLPITAMKIILVPKLEYSSHMKDKGWQNTVNENEIAGTIGESRQIEAVKFQLKDTSYGNIKYNTHIEYIGWGNNVYNGKSSGSTGLSLRTEAIRCSLDGKANQMFDIIYKVHIAEKGWLDWTKNGEIAGTVGQNLRIEAFKAMVVPKDFDFNKESYIKLTQEYYNIIFDSREGECDIKSKQISYCGFYGELPIPKRVNYVFDGWYETLDGGIKASSASTLEKKSDIVLYARWIALGDINNDEAITIDDVTLIQKYLANMFELDSTQLKIADVNDDKDISIDDVTMIQKYLAGIITKLR